MYVRLFYIDSYHIYTSQFTPFRLTTPTNFFVISQLYQVSEELKPKSIYGEIKPCSLHIGGKFRLCSVLFISSITMAVFFLLG